MQFNFKNINIFMKYVYIIIKIFNIIFLKYFGT
uniref:Uncharacterized protein n=1 Tax=viral metagenome TaxID=1070528 RepID=A0A6C0H7H2_9ZZZZ